MSNAAAKGMTAAIHQSKETNEEPQTVRIHTEGECVSFTSNTFTCELCIQTKIMLKYKSIQE